MRGAKRYMAHVQAQQAANTIATVRITHTGVGRASGESNIITGPMKI